MPAKSAAQQKAAGAAFFKQPGQPKVRRWQAAGGKFSFFYCCFQHAMTIQPETFRVQRLFRFLVDPQGHAPQRLLKENENG